MAQMNVRKGDNVMVIAGKDKGKAGKVLAVRPESGRIYVEGVNIVSKSKKPRNAQDKGGILKQEGSIDASNVMHICGECGGVVRVRHTKEESDGKTRSVRVCASAAQASTRRSLPPKRPPRRPPRRRRPPRQRKKKKKINHGGLSWQKRKIRLLRQLQPINRMPKDIA